MKFTFIGCSFTVGVGLEFEKTDSSLYANIVSKHFSAKVKNVAKGGNNNYNIFLTAVNELLFDRPDKLFVQWSSFNRHWLFPGPNTSLFLSHKVEQDYNYRDIYIPKKELQRLSDQWHLLNHDYHYIIELVNYCKILTNLAQKNTQIVFINGLVPWTEEISRLNDITNFSLELSSYTKELLEFESRDDQELLKLSKHLGNSIIELNKTLWVNQFNSMHKLAVDVGNDDSHPGPKSHHLYADMIIKYLEDNNV